MKKYSDFLLDENRFERIGLEEAVLALSKSKSQIEEIVNHLKKNKRRCLITRLTPEKYSSLRVSIKKCLLYDERSNTAVLGGVRQSSYYSRVVIFSGGTSDVAVAAEAAATLRYYGVDVLEIYDVGVAGLWRLCERVKEIDPKDILIVVAGMDAALVSVVGGLFSNPIVAVPTSVGYGVANKGATALGASLASCSAGVSVVNIDNGFGAACSAIRLLNLISEHLK